MDYSIYRTRFRDGLRMVSETVSASVATSICGDVESDGCRDDSAALRLKIAAIASILVAGVIGVALPLVVKKCRFLRTDGGFFLFFKAFAAGVILATGFVHMLADAEEALTDDCLPEWPWRRFPFPGFVAMVAALATLVVEVLTTQFYERKNRDEDKGVVTSAAAVAPAEEITDDLVLPGTEERKEGMHIVGMHAHAAEHSHGYGHVHGHGYGHGNGHDDEGQVSSHVRHVVVSQILELGIVSHSMIIGLSLGVSQSPCTIRPLMAALSFHQFFEGFALGGCISQAQFKNLRAVLMASFFAITTPMGIAVGVAVASFYNANSPRALLVEGLLDSVSAGILIYMALVDLIAADFLSKSLSCNSRLQAVSYAALFIGALAMSGLAIWA